MADYIFSHDPVLEAVNSIISTVGSPPINSLENLTNVDAIDALRLLMKTSREIQSLGWAWNIQENVTLTPDSTSKKIVYTKDILSVIASSRYINSGGFFYDLDLRTDIFNSPITITELIREFPFEDLPESAQEYITAKAARTFQNIKLTSPEMDQVLMARETEAYIKLNKFEIDMGQYNLYDNNETVSGNQAR
jgi:hypothetical protein